MCVHMLGIQSCSRNDFSPFFTSLYSGSFSPIFSSPLLDILLHLSSLLFLPSSLPSPPHLTPTSSLLSSPTSSTFLYLTSPNLSSHPSPLLPSLLLSHLSPPLHSLTSSSTFFSSLQVSGETQVVAKVTYQNLFRLFPRLSGMTGMII